MKLFPVIHSLFRFGSLKISNSIIKSSNRVLSSQIYSSMMTSSDTSLVNLVRENAHVMNGNMTDYDPLMEQIGEKGIVLLGEATHGTHEFYQMRFDITKRLIEEKGFTAVALESDWPDCIHISRAIRKSDKPMGSVDDALGEFQRFPLWMWRNTDFQAMVEWLKDHNSIVSEDKGVSVYGLDIYSLYSSIREVIQFFDHVDPAAAKRARQLYSCFDHVQRDPMLYGQSVAIGLTSSCEREAMQVLKRMFNDQASYLHVDGESDLADEVFYARQNAEVVVGAEGYYRNIFNPTANTWNIRDKYMADTVDHILSHLRAHGRPQKVVIWAHNSHLGDCRATELGRKEWNIGQLLRERHLGNIYNVGFTTHEGTVQAADAWDEPPKLKTLVPSLPDSIEYLFHQTGLPRFLLDMHNSQLNVPLREARLERAIGVIYQPRTERISHYFEAQVSDQFDAVIHVDKSSGVEPLDQVTSKKTRVVK